MVLQSEATRHCQCWPYCGTRSARPGLDAGFCRRYLTNIIRFDLGPGELAGLQHFYTLASELELVRRRQVRLYQAPARFYLEPGECGCVSPDRGRHARNHLRKRRRPLRALPAGTISPAPRQSCSRDDLPWRAFRFARKNPWPEVACARRFHVLPSGTGTPDPSNAAQISIAASQRCPQPSVPSQHVLGMSVTPIKMRLNRNVTPSSVSRQAGIALPTRNPMTMCTLSMAFSIVCKSAGWN